MESNIHNWNPNPMAVSPCPRPSNIVRHFITLSIHPSIFVRLCGAESQGQLPEQGHPDFPGHFLQLSREDPKAFPGQLSDIVTPACPGSSSGSPPGGTFLPITPLQVTLSLPTWALKSPSRTTESPVGALSSTPPRDSKKARYSALLFGP